MELELIELMLLLSSLGSMHSEEILYRHVLCFSSSLLNSFYLITVLLISLVWAITLQRQYSQHFQSTCYIVFPDYCASLISWLYYSRTLNSAVRGAIPAFFYP